MEYKEKEMSIEKIKIIKETNKPKHYMIKINQKKIEFKKIKDNKNERITKDKSIVFIKTKSTIKVKAEKTKCKSQKGKIERQKPK